MRRIRSLFIAFLCVAPAWGAFDSALAPYPNRKAGFAPAVEELLVSLAANAPHDGAFTAQVSWLIETEQALDNRAEGYGPFSQKSTPNWYWAQKEGYWSEGTYSLEAKGTSWRMVKPEDEKSPSDFWQKEGEGIYTRAFSDRWPTVWQFHHDALEADLLSYGEGLGLLLWAFNPDEYIRRADDLAIGEDREVGEKIYTTLVATPAWLKRTLQIAGEDTSPDSYVNLASWAPLRPKVTYFIDAEAAVVVGAEFEYFEIVRTGDADWTAGASPSGVVVVCFADEIAENAGGTRYPSRITGEVWDNNTAVRRLSMAVTVGAGPAAVSLTAMPSEKRIVEPWPLYAASVYEARIAAGDRSHRTTMGLAKALAFEGMREGAISSLGSALAGLEADATITGDPIPEVGKEFANAFRVIMERSTTGELEGLLGAVPHTQTWFDVVSYGIDAYVRHNTRDAEHIAILAAAKKRLYRDVREPVATKQFMEGYQADLLRRADEAGEAGNDEERAFFEKLAREVGAELTDAQGR